MAPNRKASAQNWMPQVPASSWRRSVNQTQIVRANRGAQWNDHRTTLNGIVWLLHTNAQWREVPQRYGKWHSVYDLFRRCRKDSTIDRILRRLRLKRDEAGR